VLFSLYSAHAEAVELCIYDDSGERELSRTTLPGRAGDIWHGFAPGLAPGCRYGYRVHGPFAPWHGHRFNAQKLLIDPYGRALAGVFRWDDSHLGHDPLHPDRPSAADNAAFMPQSVVCGEPGAARPGPATPWSETILYEMHLKGFTRLHPAIPEAERGTVAALGSDAVVDYLKALGITAVELLPVHAYIDEPFLQRRGLTNYWGYNTLSFFALHQPYAAGAGPETFRAVVNRFHDAGLEVILDVVYNHSCEGDEHGPTLSFRGIDNYSYYRLDPADPARYVNDTGCGNTLATQRAPVRTLVLDSLRYWAGDMGVDGFRFDLATVLGRGDHGFDPHAALLRQIADDPLLRRCKLIAEPWDVGEGGYRIGGFPPPWSEWNDRYRDSVRRFWRGDDGELPELARRLHGSGEIYEEAGRAPWSSINFITSHDGFTLRDLVSYARRHNLANGEDNRDGHPENFSDNCGAEGPSRDPVINARRARQQRNMLATLLLSQGVPMLLAGDELGRSQRGNNNAYCQDNDINWLQWDTADRELQRFTRGLIALRAASPLLTADRFRHADPDAQGQSLRWLAADGSEPEADFWNDPDSTAVGCLLSARGAGADGQLLLLLNAGHETLSFALPPGADWHCVLDTASEPWLFHETTPGRERVRLENLSLKLLATGSALERIVGGLASAMAGVGGEP
jgi:glycogen operon protein